MTTIKEGFDLLIGTLAGIISDLTGKPEEETRKTASKIIYGLIAFAIIIGIIKVYRFFK